MPQLRPGKHAWAFGTDGKWAGHQPEAAWQLFPMMWGVASRAPSVQKGLRPTWCSGVCRRHGANSAQGKCCHRHMLKLPLATVNHTLLSPGGHDGPDTTCDGWARTSWAPLASAGSPSPLQCPFSLAHGHTARKHWAWTQAACSWPAH